MKTIVLEIDDRFGEEFKGTYELRQVTQGEYERLLVSYMDALGKVSKQNILCVNREMLWLALTLQPENKPLSRDQVVQGQLPHGLSIKLQEAYDKVNGLSVEEQRFLSEPSEEENPMRDSINLLSVNDSGGQKPNTLPLAEGQSLSFQ